MDNMDTFHIILSYLDIIDIYNLCQVNKRCKKYIDCYRWKDNKTFKQMYKI